MTDHYYRGEQMNPSETNDTDENKHATGDDYRDQILNRFEQALYDENAIIESTTEDHGEHIHSTEGVVGTRQELVSHIEVAAPPGFVADITIEHSPKTHIFPEDDEPEYEYEPPTIDVSKARSSTEDEYTCEGCGRPFDRTEWGKDEDRTWGGRSGGETYFQCPTDDCPGLAYVGW